MILGRKENKVRLVVKKRVDVLSSLFLIKLMTTVMTIIAQLNRSTTDGVVDEKIK